MMESLYIILTKDFGPIKNAVDKHPDIKHWFFNSNVGLFVITELNAKELFALVENAMGKNTYFITKVYDKPGVDFWGRLPSNQWEHFNFRKGMVAESRKIQEYMGQIKSDDLLDSTFFSELAEEIKDRTINANQLRSMVYEMLFKLLTHEDLLNADELTVQRMKEVIARQFVETYNNKVTAKPSIGAGDKGTP